VIAGQTPIDLFLNERRTLYEIRKPKKVEIKGIGKDTENIKKVIRKEITKMAN